MPVNRRQTYADLKHWRQYQRFLPEPFRITPGREPAEEWWTWRSADIHLDRYAAPDAPLTVIMLHGGGGCGRLLAPYGRMLHNHGYEVVAPDLPGYGLSNVPLELFAYDAWVDCVVALAEAEIARSGRPVALFGLSIGGYLAYLAAAKGRMASAVVVTTLADPRLAIVRDQFARNPRLNRLLSPCLSAVVPWMGGLRLPVRWFCNMKGVANHPEVARLLASDPVGGGNRVPLRFMHSLLSIKPALEPEEFHVCPVLLAHPGDDRWTTPEASTPFFDRIKAPKEFALLKNCGHYPIEEPGVRQLEQLMVGFLAGVCEAPQPMVPRPTVGDRSDRLSCCCNA